MSDRERLIEIVEQARAEAVSTIGSMNNGFATWYADKLLANGVIILPCKIGDTVWAIRDFKGVKHPQEGIVSDMYFTKDMSLNIVVKYVARGEFGKTVFLTREEAEAKLREVDHEKD